MPVSSTDSNGNRLSKTGQFGTETGAYDDQDRMTAYAGCTYAYTANGELTTKTCGSEETTYQYDTFGNLTHVVMPDGITIDYVIDARNRRVGKKVNGTLVQGFLYGDQLNPVAELDGGGNIVARFVYGTKPNVPEYMMKGGVTYRYIADQLGSVRLVVDASTGAVAERIDYDEYGVVIQDTSPGFQPFGFAGGITDTHTGLVRFGARDYDPASGRWTSKDPIGMFGVEENLYGYVLEDPINLRDWAGLDVKNCTDHVIWVKDENSDNVYPVAPGETWVGEQDGLADPIGHPGQVFKTVTGVNAVVSSSGGVSTSGGGFKGWAGQAIRGGWHDTAWLNKLHRKGDYGWDKLFRKAALPRPSQPVDPELPCKP